MARQHTRILQFPFAASLQSALLDSYREEPLGRQLDIVLGIRAFEPAGPSEVFQREGGIRERVRGHYVAVELRFTKVLELRRSDFFANLPEISPDDPARTIGDMLSWRQPGRLDAFFLFFMEAQHVDNLMFFAGRVDYRRLLRQNALQTLERAGSSPPPLPGRLVPRPVQLHKRFGGDPVTIRLNGKPWHRRLFLGGLDIQPDRRPQVDAVLNLGEEASRWVQDRYPPPCDRTSNQGEGARGMSIEEMWQEANWVIERLKNKERVLVHCVAGLNRSSTICCAVLILLEGLSAEQALERVREHHPWSRPDSHHWLALRWLESSAKE